MNKLKRLLSIILTVVVIISCVPTGYVFAENENSYNVGDIIEFGNYPQSLVKDETLIAELNGIESEWISFGYYTGSGTRFDGNMTAKDFAVYRDVKFGNEKYRAVLFTQYRPRNTGKSAENNLPLDNYIVINGYRKDTVYWFKYEPIRWRVLNPSNGYIMSENIIDTQAYNNFVLEADGEYYGDAELKSYANNYSLSSIRQWLNEDFYNTAFTDEQKANIKETINSNTHYSFDEPSYTYTTPDTSDKIFLPSFTDLNNPNYGFEEDSYTGSVSRIASGTDYAKCNGLYIWQNNPEYWLRTAKDSSSYVNFISYNGKNNNGASVDDCSTGVRPVCMLSSLSDNASIECSHSKTITIPGVAPTCVQTGLTNEIQCSFCQEILQKQNIIEKVPHNYTSQVVEATCTAGGYTVSTCSVCGDIVTDNFTGATEHNQIVTKHAKAPAYKEAGWTEEISCSVCNTVLVQSKALSALNYNWEYDNNCHLYITGEGSIDYSDTYGWEAYKNEIMYVEISEGITGIPENFFSGTPYLTEVYLDSNVTSIRENAFSDCPLLTAVTFTGNTTIGNDAFKRTNEHLTFVLDGSLPAPRYFAEQNGIKIVTTSYDNETKTLSFNGDMTIQDFAEYKFLNNALYNHADSEYIYFSKLIFADADSDFFIDDNDIDASISSDGLILNNVYVSLILVSENGEQIVSFAKMLELLESGDYDAFKYKLVSDEKEEEGNLFTKFIERALEFISKLINLIRKLFTKK